LRPLVAYVKAWIAADPEPDQLRVEATPAAIAFIQEGGGRLFVWADDHGLVHTKLHAPDVLVDFERIWCDGFEFNVDRSITPVRTPTWYVVFHRFPWRHVEATMYKDSTPSFGDGAG
jgi:hypothetical protein